MSTSATHKSASTADTQTNMADRPAEPKRDKPASTTATHDSASTADTQTNMADRPADPKQDQPASTCQGSTALPLSLLKEQLTTIIKHEIAKDLGLPLALIPLLRDAKKKLDDMVARGLLVEAPSNEATNKRVEHEIVRQEQELILERINLNKRLDTLGTWKIMRTASTQGKLDPRSAGMLKRYEALNIADTDDKTVTGKKRKREDDEHAYLLMQRMLFLKDREVLARGCQASLKQREVFVKEREEFLKQREAFLKQREAFLKQRQASQK